MFDNIASLKLVKGPNNEMLATAMVSAEGEQMEFRQTISAEGRVEDWMTAVLNEMRRTNRKITKEAIFLYCANNKTRSDTTSQKWGGGYFLTHINLNTWLIHWLIDLFFTNYIIIYYSLLTYLSFKYIFLFFANNKTRSDAKYMCQKRGIYFFWHISFEHINLFINSLPNYNLICYPPLID